jgi:hypothetical protein
MDEVNNTIRFSLAETKEALHGEIAEILPTIKTEWTMQKEESGVPYFTTIIGRVKIEVHERYANFVIEYKSKIGETRKYENVKKVGNIKKPQTLNMYKSLVKRFADEEEYAFYKRVLRTLNGQANIQRERNEVTFTENADSRETDSHN